MEGRWCAGSPLTPTTSTLPFLHVTIALSNMHEHTNDPSITYPDDRLIMRIERQVDEEAQLSGSTLAFMQNAIPALPVLLLGFICLEGEELVRRA